MAHRAAFGPDIVDRVFDHVQRRRLLVQPAGKDALIIAFAVANVQLNEGSGQRLDLPGGGRLAGAKTDDGIADPHRLARTKGEIARQAVALVQEAENGLALGHRRGSGRKLLHRLGNVDRLHFRLHFILLVLLRCAARIAAAEKDDRKQKRQRAGAHRFNRESRLDSRRSPPGAVRPARELRTAGRPMESRSGCRSAASGIWAPREGQYRAPPRSGG